MGHDGPRGFRCYRPPVLRGFLLLPVLLAGLLQAQPALRLTREELSAPLSGHLSLLRDPGGALGIEGARRSMDWTPLAKDFSLGYTADVAWIRFEVERAPTAPAEWLLEFGGTILDDVTLWSPDGAGNLVAQRSGADVPRGVRPIENPYPLFPLHLRPGGQELFARIQTRSSLTARLRLVQPVSYWAGSRTSTLAWGLFYGAIALIVLFQLLVWASTREPVAAWYAAYVVLYAGSSLITIGYPQLYLGVGGRAAQLLCGVMICGSVGAGSVFISLALDLARVLPRFNRGFLAVALSSSAVGSALVLSGRYGAGVSVAQVATLLLLPVVLAASVVLAFRGHGPARILLVAFGLFFAGVSLRFLRNMGVIPPGPLADNGIHAGALANILTLSIGLSARFARLKRKAARAQAEALEATRRLAESLEAEVAAQTVELRQEVRRRSVLEEELRRSLDVERSAREVQHDFVAMVSHEFRAPLTNIDMAAQRLRSNPDDLREKVVRRYEEIGSAVERMTSLVNDYLSADRLAGDEGAFQPQPSILGLVLARVVAELPDGRITVEADGLPETFPCDPDLLHVALRNLLANADRHTPRGVPIRLVAGPTPDGGVELAVVDAGDGIPADELPHLFRKYFRGRDAKGAPGAGLGLYLVEKIARQHGGSVTVASPPGAGATFRIRLPGALPA